MRPDRAVGSLSYNLNWWWYVRGGTGVVTDNVIPNISSTMWGNKPKIDLTIQNSAPECRAKSLLQNLPVSETDRPVEQRLGLDHRPDVFLEQHRQRRHFDSIDVGLLAERVR